MMSRILQPHWRLAYALILGLLASAIQQPHWLIGLNGIGILGCTISLWRYPTLRKTFVRRWLTLAAFISCLWLTLSWQIGKYGVEINPAGIQLAGLISLRMHFLFCALWLCLCNLKETQFVQAVSKLPLPDKFIYLVIFTVRYIRMLGETNQRLEIAMRARGYQAKCNWRTFNVNAQRVALLLIQAFIKVEKSQMALKARGFRFQGRTSALDNSWWKWLERAVLFFCVLWIYFKVSGG